MIILETVQSRLLQKQLRKVSSSDTEEEKCFTGNIFPKQPSTMFHMEQPLAKKMFHGEHFFLHFLAITGTVILSTFTFLSASQKIDPESFFLKSLKERAFYQGNALSLIAEHPFRGEGMGQSIFDTADIPDIPSWQIQPTHNIFLLVFSELGGIGFILFLLFLLQLLFWKHNVSRETLCFTQDGRPLLVSYLFIGCFDHYFWDIQTGILLFFLILGWIGSSRKQEKDAHSLS